MKLVIRFAAAALVAAAHTAAAQEQMPQEEGFFGKPAFVLQPGIVITPVLSPVGDPEDDPDTEVGVNVRFTTVIPTALPWFQLIGGVQFQPNGIGGNKNNTPSVYYGGVIPFAAITEATGGWFSMSLNPLGFYTAGGGGSSRPYGHDFVLEGALVANVGQKMFQTMGFFSSASIYALLDQRLTHNKYVDENGEEKNDYFSPIALVGVTIPIGR